MLVLSELTFHTKQLMAGLTLMLGVNTTSYLWVRMYIGCHRTKHNCLHINITYWSPPAKGF